MEDRRKKEHSTQLREQRGPRTLTPKNPMSGLGEREPNSQASWQRQKTWPERSGHVSVNTSRIAMQGHVGTDNRQTTRVVTSHRQALRGAPASHHTFKAGGGWRSQAGGKRMLAQRYSIISKLRKRLFGVKQAIGTS